jgi:hypothetical protein
MPGFSHFTDEEINVHRGSHSLSKVSSKQGAEPRLSHRQSNFKAKGLVTEVNSGVMRENLRTL